MTRLTEDDIRRLPELLPEIDRAFLKATGAGIEELASRGAAGPVQPGSEVTLEAETPPGASRPHQDARALGFEPPLVAVVPVSSGQGFIPGFVEAVAAVSRFVGLETFVSEKTDVAGLALAAERGARFILLADDERFICLDLHSGGLADNGEATGRGYAAALSAAASQHPQSGPVPGFSASASRQAEAAAETVFILGLGPVGLAAARWLSTAGHPLTAYDPDEGRVQVAHSLGIDLVASPEEGMSRARLVLDACPAACLIGAELLREDSIVAGPGMPSALTADAQVKLGDRFLHEPLALGVFTMLLMSLFSAETRLRTQAPRG